MDAEYKKRLLLRCIHHFKSDLINDMDHMHISGYGYCNVRDQLYCVQVLDPAL